MLRSRYAIRDILGTGGMSTVYMADDLRLIGKKWAVKESRTAEGDPTSNGDRAEAELLVRLHHPHLPNVVDYFPPDEQGYSYLVMEYVAGETLLSRFEKSGGRLNTQQVIRYAIQLCDVLQYLHTGLGTPVIYRDMKPSNIMIDEHDQVKLIDFGIARSFKTGQGADTMPLGTHGFASPEQFAALQTDPRSDLYNLGAMLYYLISWGTYYVSGGKPLRSFGADDNVSAIVEKLLQDKPDDRYPSAEAVKLELIMLERAWEPNQRYATIREEALYGGKDGAGSIKVIVAAGLYPGAGATFLALALAAVLDRCAIPHAVVEYPRRDPELYAQLFGVSSTPPGYRYYTDVSHGSGESARGPEWTLGRTGWYPLPPDYGDDGREWNADGTDRFIKRIGRPVVIVDLCGSMFDNADALLARADEIIFVADPAVSKYGGRACKARLLAAKRLMRDGKTVRLAANKAPALQGMKMWLDALPIYPECVIPAVPYKQVVEAQWNGQQVQRMDEVAIVLEKALKPIVDRCLGISRNDRQAQA